MRTGQFDIGFRPNVSELSVDLIGLPIFLLIAK